MRVVLVHGINNQGKSSQQIIDEWLDALEQVLSPQDLATVRRAEIVAPYYGDILFEATRDESRAGPRPIAQSIADAPDEEADFYLSVLEDIAPSAGVTESDIRAEAGATAPVEMGIPHDRRLLAVVRALERISPLKGRLALRLLPQAFVYLRRQHVADAVEAVVGPALQGGPCVVVAHSLGTIVAYKLLRAADAIEAPFFLTLGSPLAIKAVQNSVGPAFERSACVGRWLNGLDPDDAVTIGRALKETTFGPGVENIDDIENGEDDPHAIGMYLRDRRVADALVRAVSP